MIWIAVALAAAQVQAGPWTKYSGPAILRISRTTVIEWVPFSSFARCQAAARMLQEEDAEHRRQQTAKGYQFVAGTEPRYRCIPG